MYIQYIIPIVAIVILLTSCKKEELIDNHDYNFAIYLVENASVTEALMSELNDLSLEDHPIITDENISEYQWELQKCTMIMDEDFKTTIEDILLYKTPVDGKAFVVVCNGERIYCGAFWTGISSLIGPNCPTIMTDFMGQGYFEIGYMHEEYDMRKNDKIKRIFEEQKKLR